MSEDLLILREVCKKFNGVHVLKGVTFSVERGQVVCILGPSGSGKSTLLRCINHIEPLDAGQIWVDQQLVGYSEHKGRLHELHPSEIARARADIGMVFQRFNLFSHFTVIDNVTIGPICVRGESKMVARQRAQQLLEQVGLGDRAEAYPNQLSGGQQQRVAIARALAMQPKLMLFDEPTSALDPELVGGVLDVIRDLAVGGMTMVVVSHEIGFAREAADKVVFMDDGAVIEEGPPSAVLDNPHHPRTQAFLSAVL